MGRPPFVTEVRRRLWHQLRFLDTFYALDRGEELLVKEASSDTPLPSNCNDSEFGEFSAVVPKHKIGQVTDLSFSLMAYEAIEYIRRFSILGTDRNGTTWQQRLMLAERFRESMESQYLRHCDLSDPFQRMLHTICKSLIAVVNLRAVRPMQSHCLGTSPRVDDPYVLELALNSLKASESVCTDPETRRWHWLLWVPWQAIAVTLAALCTIRDTDLANEAWVYVQKGYDRYSSHVADARKGLLWQPIEKLYRKASTFRDHRTNTLLRKLSTSQSRSGGCPLSKFSPRVKPGLMQTSCKRNDTMDFGLDGRVDWGPMGPEFWDMGWIDSEENFRGSS